MPGTARLDTPGLLHHIMVRGIERLKRFNDDRKIDMPGGRRAYSKLSGIVEPVLVIFAHAGKWTGLPLRKDNHGTKPYIRYNRLNSHSEGIRILLSSG